MAAWPSDLPQFVDPEGYQESRGINIVRTQMDAGPAKQRRRGTAATDTIAVTMLLTIPERATFITFFDTDLKEGALTFTWVHPVTRVAETFRIEGGQYTLQATSQVQFRLSMKLEILP